MAGNAKSEGPSPMASAAQADPLRQVAEARARLALFWSAEAEGFREMWANLSREERSKLVRNSSPHMPASPKDTVCVCGCGADLKGSAILFPELVHELLIGDAVLCLSEGETRFDLPAIMEAHATTDNKQQELADLAYISNLQSQGVLKVSTQQPDFLYVLAGENRGKAIKVGAWVPECEDGLESGLFVDGVTWEYLTKKQMGMMALLAAWSDKYYTIREVQRRRAGESKQ